MKLNLIFLLITLNSFGQNSTVKQTPEKGILISSAQISKYKVVKIKNVNFDLVLENRDTIYIQTNETKFITKEGYHVGQTFSELPSLVKESLVKEDGWGYFYTFPSGWSIAFCEEETCTGNYPNEDSKIKWIFKRK